MKGTTMAPYDMSDPSVIDLIGIAQCRVSIEHYLDVSRGEPTMSPEDVKLALVTLHLMLKRQQSLNETLVERIKMLENKKPWYRF